MNKKLMILAALVCSGALAAVAGMEAQKYEFTLATTSAGTNSYVLRGELFGVYVDCAASKTNTVLITDEHGTIFNKSGLTTDAHYPLLYAAYDSAAAAIVTDSTNAVYMPRALASEVTVVVTPAAGTTGTNDFKVYLLYKR